MRRILLGIIDRLLTVALVAAVVVLALLLIAPWDAAIDSHAAEPLDVNDRIIVRWEYPDGTEALPPREMALWQYVWEPQMKLSSRIGNFERVTGYILNDPEMQGHLERHGLTPDEQRFLRFQLGVE
jgi:hypothetical protein